MMRKCALSFFIFFASCHNDTNCIFHAEELVRGNVNKVHIAYKKQNSILGVSDNGNDGAKTGAYYFYENGNLSSYKFFQTEKAYDYSENYDSLGNLIEQLGIPLVDKNIKEVGKDSAYLKLYFFTLHRRCQLFQVKINNGKAIYFNYQPDSLHSNMTVAAGGLNTNNLTKIMLTFNIEYENTCTNKINNCYDTMKMVKNPRLNFAD